METTETAVRERPILFSGPMVRAILDGRKTVTRRILKPRAPIDFYGGQGDDPNDPRFWGFMVDNGDWELLRHNGEPDSYQMPCPYGVPGDRLWVRETVKAYLPAQDRARTEELGYPVGKWIDGPVSVRQTNGEFADVGPIAVAYPADGDVGMPHVRKVPSILMPRWASRITLEITGVRVERLQAITTRDAMREGAPVGTIEDHFTPEALAAIDALPANRRKSGFRLMPSDGLRADAPLPPRRWFIDLWDKINSKRASWESNPWVWVIEFRRLTPAP